MDQYRIERSLKDMELAIIRKTLELTDMTKKKPQKLE